MIATWIGETCGYLAGLSTAFCFLPQTIRTLRTKDVRGLSAPSYFIYVMGMIFWTIYGIYLHSVPIIFFNSVSFMFAATVLYMIISQRRK